MSQEFAPQGLGGSVSTLTWERWLSERSEAEREAALERVAIMVVENEWPGWLARAVVMGVVVPARV